jgi:purine nucleosidase
MAILLAHGNPEVELLAITTVAGNQTLDKTTLNARRVCTVAGIANVPIAAGCDRPLLRELVTAAKIHGESGLDGHSFGEPTVPLSDRHAVDLIVDLVMSSDGDITLVPTGPLTNIAMALKHEPRLASRVQEVVLMGGAYTRGNHSPAAEFNIAVDPEAAAVVFRAGWPLTMVGLDLTHQALATQAVSDRIAALGTPVSHMVVDLLTFYRKTTKEAAGFDTPPDLRAPTFGPRPSGPRWAKVGQGGPVHDPCAVARVIRPDLVRCVDAFVAIETKGEWSSGMTVTDFRGTLHHPPNALVATTLDFDGFWDLMLDALKRIGNPYRM